MSATTHRFVLDLFNDRAALRAGTTAKRHGNSESDQGISSHRYPMADSCLLTACHDFFVDDWHGHCLRC
jgi:hypothetical protein